MPHPEALAEAIQIAYRDKADQGYVTDALTDLRHICDQKGTSFAMCDKAAHDQYLKEKAQPADATCTRSGMVPLKTPEATKEPCDWCHGRATTSLDGTSLDGKPCARCSGADTIETVDPTNRKATADDIQAFCDRLTLAKQAHFAKGGSNVCGSEFYPSKGGNKYIRIVERHLVHGEEASQSAHCFVRVSDGNLFKPDGWKGPTLNFSRGSVYDVNVNENTGR